jgi:hypothetical protein
MKHVTFVLTTCLWGAVAFCQQLTGQVTTGSVATVAGTAIGSGNSSSSSGGSAANGSGSSSSGSGVLPAFYVVPSGSDANPGTLAAPFATLAKARAAARASSVKTVYLRSGIWSKVALTLTSADNGETWSYYPPDGYDTAVLDGGASSPTTGSNPITIDGGSNITVNGLTIQNFPVYGVGVHGGPAWPEFGFRKSVAVANGDKLVNNIIRNGYDTTGNGWRGAIYGLGSVPNLAILHNGIDNMYAGGTWFNTNVSPQNYAPAGNYTGLDIEGNAITHVCQQTGDCAPIYQQDINYASTGEVIKNNFLRDYQAAASALNPNAPLRDVAIYFDWGAGNATVSGNVIGPTSNAITNTAIQATQVLQLSASHNVSFSCNIVDLGPTGKIANLVYQAVTAGEPAMTGNSLTWNLFIGKWSGAQSSASLGVGPYAYISGYTNPSHATVSKNFYFNYGAGSLSTTGNDFSDVSPVTGQDPLLSGTYTVAAGSPWLAVCPPIVGGWGPPGYVIPTGTAASSN